MSSKPGNGINHKEFGVTSEGVAVYVAAALRDLSIDPSKDAFSVAITGGPDGDVGGNLLKILFRDCERASVVGVADGIWSGVESGPGTTRLSYRRIVSLSKEAASKAASYQDRLVLNAVPAGTGVAEDPDGLDRDELLRLVEASEGIASFSKSKLGANGVVADDSASRDSMLKRVKADVFVPCGGRPGARAGPDQIISPPKTSTGRSGPCQS